MKDMRLKNLNKPKKTIHLYSRAVARRFGEIDILSRRQPRSKKDLKKSTEIT